MSPSVAELNEKLFKNLLTVKSVKRIYIYTNVLRLTVVYEIARNI